MTLNNLVFFVGVPTGTKHLCCSDDKITTAKRHYTSEVTKKCKISSFFSFSIIFLHSPTSFSIFYHVPISPKILHFGTCFRHPACVFFIVLTHLQQKKTQPFQIVPYLSITFCFICLACSFLCIKRNKSPVGIPISQYI